MHTHFSCQKGGSFYSFQRQSPVSIYHSTLVGCIFATAQQSPGLSKDKPLCGQVQHSRMIHTPGTILHSNAEVALHAWRFSEPRRSPGACVLDERVACHVALITDMALMERVQQEFSTDSLFMHFYIPADSTGEPIPLCSGKVHVLVFYLTLLTKLYYFFLWQNVW